MDSNAVSTSLCLLHVIAGFDEGGDPRQYPSIQVPKYSKLLTNVIAGKKIGIVKEGFEGCELDVVSHVQEAALSLRRLGAEVEEMSLPMHTEAYNPSVDWTVRHGRSIALGVALKEAGDLLCTAHFQDSVKEAVVQLTDADRIPLCLSGYRCVGYLLAHQIKNDCLTEEFIPMLIKGMKHDSNEVKQLVGQLVSYLTHLTEKPLPPHICRLFIPSMVMGTKEKNTAVKANCEFALISLLKLRAGESNLKAVIPFLDSGMQDVLKEVVSKSLKKLCNQPELPMEQIDETILV